MLEQEHYIIVGVVNMRMIKWIKFSFLLQKTMFIKKLEEVFAFARLV